MMTLNDLNKERDEILSKLSGIDEQITDKKKKTLVQCTHNHHYGDGCGMGHAIDTLTYIQTHWYEGPHGCMGGDNWHMGEGNFICHHCGHRNRLHDRPEIADLKHLFKDIVEERNK